MPRAARYEVQLQVRYRAAREPNWNAGESRNVSTSGVLLTGERLLDVNTPVELDVVMPGLGTLPPARLVCAGKVVRLHGQPPGDGRPLFAVRFAARRMARPRRDGVEGS